MRKANLCQYNPLPVLNRDYNAIVRVARQAMRAGESRNCRIRQKYMQLLSTMMAAFTGKFAAMARADVTIDTPARAKKANAAAAEVVRALKVAEKNLKVNKQMLEMHQLAVSGPWCFREVLMLTCYHSWVLLLRVVPATSLQPMCLVSRSGSSCQ